MPQLLGGSKPQQSALPDMTQEKRISELSERTRLLEERLKQARSRVQVIDETNITKIRELRDGINNLSSDIATMRKDFDELKEIVRRMAKELGQAAKLSDIRVLEKYISMLDVTRIVTREEVLRIIKDEVSKSKKKD